MLILCISNYLLNCVETLQWKWCVVCLRWAAAITSVMSSLKMVRDANVMNNRSFSATDRLAATVRLEMALRDTPHGDKKLLVRALQKRAEGNYTGIGDMILNELFITGEKLFMWWVDSKRHTYWLPEIVSVTLCTINKSAVQQFLPKTAHFLGT